MTDQPLHLVADQADSAYDRTPEYLADIRLKLSAIPSTEMLWHKRRDINPNEVA